MTSDNVNMIALVGTANGRIFAGGRDGHVHEIEYQVCGAAAGGVACRAATGSSTDHGHRQPPTMGPASRRRKTAGSHAVVAR